MKKLQTKGRYVAARGDFELVLTHEFDAPRALVFRAWTQQHAAQWWGPEGFTTVSCRIDARPGGAYRLAMRGPDGTVRTKRGVYREVTPDRIVFSTPGKMPTAIPGVKCT